MLEIKVFKGQLHVTLSIQMTRELFKGQPKLILRICTIVRRPRCLMAALSGTHPISSLRKASIKSRKRTSRLTTMGYYTVELKLASAGKSLLVWLQPIGN